MTWQHWVNALLGLWVILSAITDFTFVSQTTNLTITGLLIVLFGIWGAVQHQMYHRQT